MLAVTAARGGRQVTALLLLDDYTLFFIGLLVLTTAGVVLISYGYLEAPRGAPRTTTTRCSCWPRWAAPPWWPRPTSPRSSWASRC